MTPSVHLRGWKAFVQSPFGTATAFVALLAVLAQTLAPDPPPDSSFAGASRFALTLIVMACVAVMASRDRRADGPALAAARVDV